ncbi:MAG: M56 family metallopeptidase [Robinsoniella sp.]|nr:M56 family metallopeptidase [Robinsoniella sp.]
MDGVLFGRILEMSLIGSYCIFLVLPVRLLLLKCERKYAYYLWLAVFLNLSVPFALQGKVSLIPRQVAEFSIVQKEDVERRAVAGTLEEFQKTSGNGKENRKEASKPPVTEGKTGQEPVSLVQMQEQGNSPQWSFLLQIIWLSGLLGIVAFNLAHMFRINKGISKEKWVFWDDEKRIAEVKGLASPFLWGILRPIIFLPAGLKGEERTYIIAHECIHRKRRDSILKIVVFLITAVHWFNPVVWVAWILFCMDMEISCDEAVLAEAEENRKKQYAQSLLKFAAAQNGYLMVPLTFGEPSAKTRIKNVLRFQKKNALLTGMAGVVVAVMALGLAVHPVEAEGIFRGGVYGGILGKNETKESLFSWAGISVETNIKNIESMKMWENAYTVRHREGYVEAAVTHVPDVYEQYFISKQYKEEELDTLAQRALQELYDLTGFKVEACVYDCTELGDFYFAKTREDLECGRYFYCRGFEEVSSMDIANSRWFWFSDVEQLDVPENIESMENGELAAWFLKRSAVYQGEELSGEIDSFPYGEEGIRVMTVDGSYYKITLDRRVNGVSSIYGPYPEEFGY